MAQDFRAVPGWHFSDARDLFEQAREASRDAERIRRQLSRMEASALSVGGGSGSPVSGTSDPHAMEARVAALVDREADLQRREDEDYMLIDLACWVLYGMDNETGLAAIVPTWWADVLWWRYLARATWERTAEALGYSERRCQQVHDVALDTIDANDILGTMKGAALNSLETWEHDSRRRASRERLRTIS